MSTQMRCPQWHQRLFGKTGVWDGKPGVEMSCQDCRRTAHRKGDTDVELVLHRYALTGELFATEIVRSSQQSGHDPVSQISLERKAVSDGFESSSTC